MIVNSVFSNFNKIRPTYENEKGLFWIIESNYLPNPNEVYGKQYYNIFRFKSKINSKISFVAYDLGNDPVIASNSIEDLYLKLNAYDFARRCQ